MNPATVPFAASRKLPGKMPSSSVATTSTTSAKKSEGGRNPSPPAGRNLSHLAGTTAGENPLLLPTDER